MGVVPTNATQLADSSRELGQLLRGLSMGEVWESEGLRSLPSLEWLCGFLDAIDANGKRTCALRLLLDICPSSTQADFDRKVRELVPLSLRHPDSEADGQGTLGEVTPSEGGQELRRGICAVAAFFIAAGVPQERVLPWLDGSDEETEIPPDRLLRKANGLYERKRWWERDYTLARRCYTALGSRPLGATERRRLLDIYQTRNENVRMLARAIIYVACMIAFAAAMCSMTVGRGSLTPLAVVSSALGVAIVGLGFWRFRRGPFNGLSGLVAGLYVAWLAFALLAV